MKKVFSWLSDNILYVYTLFLLAFIPLYPKLPLVDVNHTWVYIRADDFAIAIGVMLFLIQLLRRKASIKIPLAIPISIYWIIGGLSTVYALFFVFPHIESGFTTLGILYYLRHIEYLSVFFIAFNSIKTKNQLKGVIVVLVLTLVSVVVYGFGQRYLGFHAFLTMNEEFAKGIPLQLSALSRVASTFAGHYDLAAYLVMMIAIVGAMISGFKNWWIKILLFLSGTGGLLLLLMTASRVSFAVYLVTIAFLLILQKRKLFIIPVIILSIVLANSFEGMTQRFASTISQTDVIVDARTGETIGIGKEITDETGRKRIVIDEEEESTGENLPKGSQYINVPSRGQKTDGEIVYKRSSLLSGSQQEEVLTLEGEYVVKKVLAYDISFTTRLGGTWPRAFEAFERNVLLGSGYSSINLASDNNYLRMLGETGILGFGAFIGIFIVYGIYIYRLSSKVKSKITKNFALGVTAGIFGLALNAVLIDVFEASKVAYILWMLMGLSLAALYLEKTKKLDVLNDLKQVLISTPAVIVYIFLVAIVVFWNSMSNYFIGDDFTWLRWAADCTLQSGVMQDCLSVVQTFANYFTNAEGFFYRPGTKIYFYFMYAIFWLSPVMYHLVSVLLHALISSIIYILGSKILKSKLFGAVLALMFLISSAHFEAVYWISVTGHLISILSVLLAILLFSVYMDKNKIIFLIASIVLLIVAPFFHEYAVVGPLLVILYSLTFNTGSGRDTLRKYWKSWISMLLIIPVYLYLRVQAGSVGMHGDYNYNLIKLPVNAAGNALGYVMYNFIGIRSIPWYDSLRSMLREDLVIALFIAAISFVIIGALLLILLKRIKPDTRKVLIFGVLFFIISMAPFLGLGNIAPRYVYFGSFGLLLIAVLGLKFLYTKISKANLRLAQIVLVLVVLSYTLFHVKELQRVHLDWEKASSITRTTVEELTAYYLINGEHFDPNPIYYVVNVPIRYGYSWVFPVGFEDAIWFTAQNADIKVKTTQNIEEAIQFSEANKNTKMFIYDKDGNFERIIREE